MGLASFPMPSSLAFDFPSSLHWLWLIDYRDCEICRRFFFAPALIFQPLIFIFIVDFMPLMSHFDARGFRYFLLHFAGFLLLLHFSFDFSAGREIFSLPLDCFDFFIFFWCFRWCRARADISLDYWLFSFFHFPSIISIRGYLGGGSWLRFQAFFEIFCGGGSFDVFRFLRGKCRCSGLP